MLSVCRIAIAKGSSEYDSYIFSLTDLISVNDAHLEEIMVPKTLKVT